MKQFLRRVCAKRAGDRGNNEKPKPHANNCGESKYLRADRSDQRMGQKCTASLARLSLRKGEGRVRVRPRCVIDETPNLSPLPFSKGRGGHRRPVKRVAVHQKFFRRSMPAYR